MFGLFKKKAAPAPVELSDAELDLIQGGGHSVSGTEVTDTGDGYIHEFAAPNGLVAVVGRCDQPGPLR